MKDLRFSGTNLEGVDVDVTFRTDLISSSAQNFNVIQIAESGEFNSNISDEAKRAFNDFKLLPYNLAAFKQFASDQGLTLRMMESTGADEQILIDNESSESASV